MAELSDRQRSILLLVIRDYIESGLPVGSAHLVENYKLNISTATIRNEMVALTELGYLRQPHTSAGRVPTEEGYRFLVSQTTLQAELPEPVQNTILHQFHQSRPEVDQWMTLAASVLASHSQAISLVTAPFADRNRVKHIELISTQGRQVLMVMVMYGGAVNQQFLTIAEPVSQEKLSEVAQKVNIHFRGKTSEEIHHANFHFDALELDILHLIMVELNRVDDKGSGHIYYDGLSNMMAIRDFSGSDDAANALRLIDERTSLRELIQSTANNTGLGDVNVVIGGEGGWHELKKYSMVLARYGVPGYISGTLGVLGPMRMAYSRTIPTVRYVANILSDIVLDNFIEQSN
jgi:heat-inducible transcriptional repressor